MLPRKTLPAGAGPATPVAAKWSSRLAGFREPRALPVAPWPHPSVLHAVEVLLHASAGHPGREPQAASRVFLRVAVGLVPAVTFSGIRWVYITRESERMDSGRSGPQPPWEGATPAPAACALRRTATAECGTSLRGRRAGCTVHLNERFRFPARQFLAPEIGRPGTRFDS